MFGVPVGTMSRTAYVLLGLLVVLLGALPASSARAASPRSGSKAVVLHLRFRRVGPAESVTTNGRYVLFPSVAPIGVTSASSTLIDEQTQTRTELSTAGGAFGGPWLWSSSCPQEVGSGSYGCTTPLQLYSLATGSESTLTINDPFCSASDGQCSYGPLGTDWLEITQGCYHCQTSYTFQNIRTGRVEQPAINDLSSFAGQGDVIDLDSPDLLRRLCKPLQNTANNSLVVDGAGRFDLSGTPLGKVAVAYRKGSPYLERCGSRARYRLPWFPDTGNPQALLTRQLHALAGVFLPSLQRFTIPIPAALTVRTAQDPFGYLDYVVLSAHSLWVTTGDNQLWVAHAPTPPRRVKSY